MIIYLIKEKKNLTWVKKHEISALTDLSTSFKYMHFANRKDTINAGTQTIPGHNRGTHSHITSSFITARRLLISTTTTAQITRAVDNNQLFLSSKNHQLCKTLAQLNNLPFPIRPHPSLGQLQPKALASATDMTTSPPVAPTLLFQDSFPLPPVGPPTGTAVSASVIGQGRESSPHPTSRALGASGLDGLDMARDGAATVWGNSPTRRRGLLGYRGPMLHRSMGTGCAC